MGEGSGTLINLNNNNNNNKFIVCKSDNLDNHPTTRSTVTDGMEESSGTLNLNNNYYSI